MLAERFVDLLKHLAGHRRGIGERLAHADRLTALPRKDECAHDKPLIVIPAQAEIGCVLTPAIPAFTGMTDFDGRAYSLTRRDASRRERPCSLRRGRCPPGRRSEEHTSELQSLMRISYAVFCLKQKNTNYRTRLT